MFASWTMRGIVALLAMLAAVSNGKLIRSDAVCFFGTCMQARLWGGAFPACAGQGVTNVFGLSPTATKR